MKLTAFTLKQALSTVIRGQLVSLQEVSGRNRSFSNFVGPKDLLAHPCGQRIVGPLGGQGGGNCHSLDGRPWRTRPSQGEWGVGKGRLRGRLDKAC